MGFKLGRSLVGHSFSLCFIFVHAFLIVRTHFGSKIVWMSWCPYSTTEGPAWLQGMVSSGPMSPLLGALAKLTAFESQVSRQEDFYCGARTKTLGP